MKEMTAQTKTPIVYVCAEANADGFPTSQPFEAITGNTKKEVVAKIKQDAKRLNYSIKCRGRLNEWFELLNAGGVIQYVWCRIYHVK